MIALEESLHLRVGAGRVIDAGATSRREVQVSPT
jgi:hypothetical protein